jgi:hypothetical protein
MRESPAAVLVAPDVLAHFFTAAPPPTVYPTPRPRRPARRGAPHFMTGAVAPGESQR